MHKLINNRPLLLLGICLFLTGCDSPKSKLDQARSTRKRVDFEHVIARYPDTPYAVKASVYILELDMWEKTRGTGEVAPYQALLTKYPKGLFVADAKANIDDIQAWELAKHEDIILAYEHYLNRPEAPLLFKERAEARKKELGISTTLYNGIEENADLKTLLGAKEELAGTGYSVLLSSQLEGTVQKSARYQIAQDKRFKAIAERLDKLPDLIAGKDLDIAQLSRLAREEIQITVLKTTQGEGRFVLPGILVHSLSKGGRFSISDLNTYHRGKLSLSFNGSPEKSPPPNIDCYANYRGNMYPIFFTELFGDRVPVSLQFFGYNVDGEHVFTTGAVQKTISALDCAAGSVWRFSGDVGVTSEIRIVADSTDPLSFYLIEDVGPVFFAGSGYVLDANDHILFEAINSSSITDEVLLGVAAFRGDAQKLQALLEMGTNVNYQNKDGITALYKASQVGRLAVIKKLLSMGANANLQAKDDTTPLYLASRYGYIEIVRLLLENDANINLQTNSGLTPLFHASINGHIEIVKLLLENGANVNFQTKNGATPLYLASKNGNIEMVKLLLKNGAIVDLQTTTGKKLVGVAKTNCIARLIRAAGAKHPKLIREVQEHLLELGYKPGPTDGLWGRKTREELKRFQKQKGLSETGKLDKITQKLLGLSKRKNKQQMGILLSKDMRDIIEFKITKSILSIIMKQNDDHLIKPIEVSPALQTLLLKYDDTVKGTFGIEGANIAFGENTWIYSISTGAKLYGSMDLLNIKFQFLEGEIGIKKGKFFVCDGSIMTVNGDQFRYVQEQWVKVVYGENTNEGT